MRLRIGRKRFILVTVAVLAIAAFWQTIRILEFRHQMAIAERLPVFWIGQRPLLPPLLADHIPPSCGEWELPVLEGIGIMGGSRDDVAQLRELSNLRILEAYETPLTARDIEELLRVCPLRVISVSGLNATESEIAAIRTDHPSLRLEIH